MVAIEVSKMCENIVVCKSKKEAIEDAKLYVEHIRKMGDKFTLALLVGKYIMSGLVTWDEIGITPQEIADILNRERIGRISVHAQEIVKIELDYMEMMQFLFC